MARKTAAARAANDIEEITDSTLFDTRTLAGDLRDVMLDLFKTRHKAWHEMTEADQYEVGNAIEYASRKLVTGVVEAITNEGIVDPVRAILEGYVDKGEIKGTFKVKTPDGQDVGIDISALHKMRGKLVLISLASADDYLGERGGFAVQPDQNGLEFADETADDTEDEIESDEED